MALARLTEVEGGMILVFERVVTKCRLAFAVCATLNSPSELQRTNQLVPIRQPQEMQYPGYAGLDAEFRKINFRCDVAITEAFADQAINRPNTPTFSQKTRMRLTSTSEL